MRRFLILSTALLFAGTLASCDTFVREVNEPKDEAPVNEFTTQVDIDFLATGVQAQFAATIRNTVPIVDLLSDQMRFGRNDTDATFPTFSNLDAGAPQIQSNSVNGAESNLGHYRRLADDLITAINGAEFEGSDPISENEARFVANFHGGIARFLYATYFGLNPREGGGVIDESAFIPSPAMYDSARVKFVRAREVAPNQRRTKILNSVEARSALYVGTEYGSDAGGYSEGALQAAANFSSQGLKQGDDPYMIPYTTQDPNGWYGTSGGGRIQIAVQDGLVDPQVQPADQPGAYKNPDEVRSFQEVLENNPAESARVPVRGVNNSAEFVPASSPDAVDLAQGKYEGQGANQAFITWQENHLMRAELELRGFSTGSKSALSLVNEVRSNFGLSSLSSVEMETIARERDRTLFATGQRLPDQRRLEVLDWHLVESFDQTTTWQYLPITRQERDNNPDL